MLLQWNSVEPIKAGFKVSSPAGLRGQKSQELSLLILWGLQPGQATQLLFGDNELGDDLVSQ